MDSHVNENPYEESMSVSHEDCLAEINALRVSMIECKMQLLAAEEENTWASETVHNLQVASEQLIEQVQLLQKEQSQLMKRQDTTRRQQQTARKSTTKPYALAATELILRKTIKERDRLRKSEEDLIAEISQMRGDKIYIERKLEVREKEIDEMQHRILYMDEELSSGRQTLIEKSEKVDTLKRSLRNEKKRTEKQTEELSRLHRCLDVFKEEVQKLMDENASLKQSKDALLDEIQKLKS